MTDPDPVDRVFPAATEHLGIDSDGSRMNAIVFVAGGEGPHPVAILLDGLPGGDGGSDLAHAMRRAGWTVLFFRYRGAWGSEGSFSFANALEDVAAAVAEVRTSRFAERYRADRRRIALVGMSMGGFMALNAGSRLSAVDCLASLAGSNMGVEAKRLTVTPAGRRATVELLDELIAPLHGTSGEDLTREGESFPDDYDLRRRAKDIASKHVLLVAGSRDHTVPMELHHAPLVRALRKAGASDVTAVVLDADHSFSDRRISLARTLIAWLARSCR